MRIAVVGLGAVGARAARQLLDLPGLDGLDLVDERAARAEAVVRSLAEPARVATVDEAFTARPAVVVVATPGPHRRFAERALDVGAAVVSVSDDPAEVRRLLALDPEAHERRLPVVVGAGFSPGLTCLLARHAAEGFDEVDEVHVAKVGTGGPACARQHHRALGGGGVEWRDRVWTERRGGTGRTLCWFPDPVGGVDCYAAALAEPLLLVPVFPRAARVTARVGASRRDRLTGRLPMLRRPHPEGKAGAARVEVRGRRGTARDVVVLGAIDRPAVAAGAVAAVAASWAAAGRLTPGAAGLGAVDALPFLTELARRGVRAATFEGSGSIDR